MNELISKLERALSRHDCVVVPGLGGFIRRDLEAFCHADSHTFYPRSAEYTFNARLSYNDGLLAEEYQRNGLSFEEANQRIRTAVTDIRAWLSGGNLLQIPGVGNLRQTNEGWSFHGCTCPRPELFGLQPIVVFPLNETSTATADTEKGESRSVKRGGVLPWIVAAAACLLLLLHLGLPRPLPPEMPQLASVLPIPSLPVESPASPDRASLESSMEQTLQQTRMPQGGVSKATKSSQKQYLTVVASFATAREAMEFIETRHLERVFPHIGIAESPDRCRVYVERYEDREEALFFLEEVRQQPMCSKAWVLVY